MMITSPQNPRIKELVHLRQSRKRRQLGRFLIDGCREVDRAVRSHFPVAEIYIAPGLLAEQTACWLKDFRTTHEKNLEFIEVSDDVFAKIAYGEREDGVLAVCRWVENSLEDVWQKISERSKNSGKNPLIGVLEGVEKPGNVGAILRSADGAGLSALILADPKTDLFNPNAIRASLGTIFSIPLASGNSTDVAAWLRNHEITTYAAIVDGAIHYTRADFTRPSAIVLGSEAWGLTDAFRTSEIQPIFLPMLGIADSLNVSTTAAILFYEALRQREGNRE